MLYGPPCPARAATGRLAQLHDQPFQQNPRIAARRLQREVGPKQRVDGRAHARRRQPLGRHAELAQHHDRHDAAIERRGRAAQRLRAHRCRWMALAIPKSVCASGPAGTDCRTSSTVIVGWPERVEHDALERRSQADDVQARAFDQRPRGRRLERDASRAPRGSSPSARRPRRSSMVPQSTTCASLSSSLTSVRRLSSPPHTNTTVDAGAGALMNSVSRSCSSSAALLSRFGISSFSASSTRTTRRGAIIGSVLAASMTASR